MSNSNLSRRAFLASAGTVLTSLTFSLASGPAAAFAADGETDAAALAANDAAADAAVDDSKIVIVHTNDVHCALLNKKTELGYAKLKDYVADQKAKHGDSRVTLVDAGDNLQGDVVGSLTQGDSPAKVIAACKYDLMTCGNHEFDYGMTTFFANRATENTPYVCCNFVDVNGNRVFDAYRVIEYQVGEQTVRVAYVGATTPSTITSSTPASFKDKDGNLIYGFCGDASGDGLVNAIQTAVDEARSKGDADYVVLLAHLGKTGVVERWRSDTVVSKTSGIDLVLDGHSHEMYTEPAKNKNGQDVPIVQTGTKFASFSRTEIDPVTGTATVALDATGVTAELIKSWDGSDPEVAELVAQLQAELEKQTKTVIGTSSVDLYAYEDDHFTWAVRSHETNMGDLVADSMFYTASNMGKACDLAFVNGGGVREDIKAGDVTYGDCVSVLPYNNQLAWLPVTGQHILDMLEIGAAKQPEAAGGFIQVSEGVTLTIRTDIPTPVVLNGDGSAVEKIEGERRVKNVCLYGKPIEADKTYNLVSINYILVGGGNAMPVPGNAADCEFLGVDVDALIDYVKTNLKGQIGKGYENAAGAGRIHITDHAEEETPVEPAEPTVPETPGDGGSGAGNGNGAGSGTGTQTSTVTTTTKKARGGVPLTGDDTVNLAAAVALGAAGLGAGALLANQE